MYSHPPCAKLGRKAGIRASKELLTPFRAGQLYHGSFGTRLSSKEAAAFDDPKAGMVFPVRAQGHYPQHQWQQMSQRRSGGMRCKMV